MKRIPRHAELLWRLSVPQDIRNYENMDAVLKELVRRLGLMQNEKVLQARAEIFDTTPILLSDEQYHGG